MCKTTACRFLILCLCLILPGGCGYPQRYPTGLYRRQLSPPGWHGPGTTVPRTQLPYVIDGRVYYPLPSAEGYTEQGIASWYGGEFHGRKTACGETYDMHDHTAAHKTLPINTMLLVRNLENGKKTVVRVNDRGPFVKKRIIDLSLTAARDLDIVRNGTARVQITALGEAVTYSENNREFERFLPHQDFNRGEFYVQVGSFANPAYARRLQKKIEARGKDTVIRTYNDGDTIFYRVHVRAGDSLAAAKHQEKVLADSGFPGFVLAR